MGINKQFIISAFDLSQRDLGMLGRGLRLSDGRSRNYSLSDGALEDADIIIADGASLEKLSTVYPLRADQALVVVGDKNAIDALKTEHEYCISRPLLAPRVLDILDRVTTEKLGFTPELVVGGVSDNEVDLLHNEENILRERMGKKTATSPDNDKLKRTKAAKKVLVVDDSLIVREQMKLILGELGTVVTTCSSGEEALEEVERNKYDVIFLDVVMPGRSGFDTCKMLKQKEINGAKVIMLTSKSSPVSRVRGRLSGANTYITKPATVDKLAQFV